MSIPVSIPTIEERLERATRAATLIRLALAADHDEAGLDMEDVVRAVVPQAGLLSDELYWITRALPATVLSSPAPTDSQRDDVAAGRAK